MRNLGAIVGVVMLLMVISCILISPGQPRPYGNNLVSPQLELEFGNGGDHDS